MQLLTTHDGRRTLTLQNSSPSTSCPGELMMGFRNFQFAAIKGKVVICVFFRRSLQQISQLIIKKIWMDLLNMLSGDTN